MRWHLVWPRLPCVVQRPPHGGGLAGLRWPAWRLGLAWLMWLIWLGALGACSTQQPATDAACAAPASLAPSYEAGVAGARDAPEIASGYTRKTLVAGRRDMVVAAHPLAAQAGCEILRRGGTAVDAAIAVQMVLGVVEPQSSGIGGGAFLLLYRAADDRVMAYDGRETAPAAATENDLRWISASDARPPQPSARASGRAIGTPGVVRMLEAAHRDAGYLPWQTLFTPAIRIADEGFAISPRLAGALAAAADGLQRDALARAHFLQADGRARPAGAWLRSPALAATLRTLAVQGADAFYRGAIAQGIVDAVASTAGGTTPGKTTLADLAQYQAIRREALCSLYRRAYVVCGMPPPSSGGLAVAQVLGILEHFELAPYKPAAPQAEGGRLAVPGVHLVAEAERLAYADRDRYVADPDFVPLPGGNAARMLDAQYLRQRAALIRPTQSMGMAAPGTFDVAPPGAAAAVPEHGTSHITIADRMGNVVALTTSIEAAFGAFHMTRGGFLLNNQLTDFAAQPVDAFGRPVANRLAAGKRPRSSMAPTLVFRARADGTRGVFFMATGSPGGAHIIQYVTKTLVGVLDWGLDAQQASALIDFGAANHPTTIVGGEHPNVDAAHDGAHDPLVAGLRALGHRVSVAAQSSGVATVVRRGTAAGQPLYEGGADPRREGVAIGSAP